MHHRAPHGHRKEFPRRVFRVEKPLSRVFTEPRERRSAQHLRERERDAAPQRGFRAEERARDRTARRRSSNSSSIAVPRPTARARRRRRAIARAVARGRAARARHVARASPDDVAIRRARGVVARARGRSRQVFARVIASSRGSARRARAARPRATSEGARASVGDARATRGRRDGAVRRDDRRERQGAEDGVRGRAATTRRERHGRGRGGDERGVVRRADAGVRVSSTGGETLRGAATEERTIAGVCQTRREREPNEDVVDARVRASMMARRGDDECDEGWRLTARRERRSDAQAQFVKMSFNAPPTLVAEAERTLRIDERVLRWVITKKRAMRRLNDYKAHDPRNPNAMQSYDGRKPS